MIAWDHGSCSPHPSELTTLVTPVLDNAAPYLGFSFQGLVPSEFFYLTWAFGMLPGLSNTSYWHY